MAGGERQPEGHDPAARLAVRQRQSAPLIEDLESWLRSQRALLSKYAKVAKAIDYLLSSDHWPGFTHFLEDGWICLTNNCAERSLRDVALGRRSWLFAGSERGGHRAAFMYSLIGSAKLNGIDPQAWLADVIAQISDLAAGVAFLELATVGGSAGKGSLMARPTYVYSIDHVARMIDKSLKLIEVVSWNSDDIDYGEMIHVLNGTGESLTAFTERGVECLQKFLADVRTWDGRIRKFLLDEKCDTDVIEPIMAYEKKA